MTRTTRIILAAAAAVLPLSPGAALAHEGGVGDGTSITLRLDTKLPAGLDAKLGNGEADFHVEPGTAVVVYGVEGEEMLKIDEGGTAYQNMNSATWQASMEMEEQMKKGESDGMDMGAAVGGAAAMASDPGNDKADSMTSVAPDWKFFSSGGGMRWHDHRIHWMSGEFPKDVAAGDELMEFALPVAINGEALTLTGALLYAGADGADEGGETAHVDTDGHGHIDDSASDVADGDTAKVVGGVAVVKPKGLPTGAILAGVLLLVGGAGALALSKSRKKN